MPLCFGCFKFPTSVVPHDDPKPSKDVSGWAASQFQHLAFLSLTSNQQLALVGPSTTAYSCRVGKQFIPPFMLRFPVMVVAFVLEFVASGCSYYVSNCNFIFMLLTHCMLLAFFFFLFLTFALKFSSMAYHCFLMQIQV